MKKSIPVNFKNIGKIIKMINSSLDLSKVLKYITEITTKTLLVKASSIRLLDSSAKNLEIKSAYKLSSSYLKKGPVTIDGSPLDKEVLKGKIVYIKDVLHDKRIQYPKEMKKEGISSVLSVPLKINKKVLGTLRIYLSDPKKFSSEEIEFLNFIAEHGAMAISNARMYERIKLLYNIIKTMNQTLDSEKILNLVTENIVKVLRVKGCSLRLLNHTKKSLELTSAYGLSDDFLKKGPVNARQNIKYELKSESIFISDVSTDKRIEYPEETQREGISSIYCVPLIVHKTVIGELRVYISKQNELTDFEKEFIDILANEGAIAIENARLYEHLKKDYDDLTKEIWEWYNIREKS
ncbi:GAF domain-containing protein [Candidatus Desantisbacteria bacterium]|nr:GAF domain-containing protein [Candidatus Desantisbacteria bacterium]